MSSAANHQRIAELASDRAVHRAFAWFHLHEQQIRKWQLEFVAVPAPPFGETERASWFSKKFVELGLENVHIDEAGNALGELRSANSTQSSPIVLLSAHLDTVFPAETECMPHEEDTRIFCPGICDNGAGLAALLGIAAAFQATAPAPKCTILFAANVGEEGAGDLRGMRHLFGASPYAMRLAVAMALEGAGDNTVVDRALGSRRIRVTVTGPGGHSWADAGRPNPILALSAGLLAISRIHLPRTPRTTLNCGVIRGGTSVNSIPESAMADLDLRSSSAQQIESAELTLLNVLTDVIAEENQQNTTGGELRLHAERIGDRAAGALPADSALAASLRAVDRHLGLVTDSRIGSTDANLPLSLGIPAVAIGAGGRGGGMHTLSEWYDPTGRNLALRRILLLLLDTCAQTAYVQQDKSTLLHSPS